MRVDNAVVRVARLHIPGVVHHLIWRFVDRQWFFTSDRERSRYLWWLGRALKDSDWTCLAYALMSSHIHLAVVAGETPLADWSRPANAPFAAWMNRQWGRLGPLFADRAKDFAKAPSAVSEAIAYIHNNPVKDGVVAVAEDSTWTSHRAYLGLDPAPSWLDVAEGIRRAGFTDVRAAVAAAPTELVSVDVRRVGHAARRHGAVVMATPGTKIVPLVARPFAHIRPHPRELVEMVCEVLELPFDHVCSRRRNAAICSAREVAAHTARRLGIVASDLAAVLGISKQSVSRIQLRRPCNDAVCELVIARLRTPTRFPSEDNR